MPKDLILRKAPKHEGEKTGKDLKSASCMPTGTGDTKAAASRLGNITMLLAQRNDLRQA